MDPLAQILVAERRAGVQEHHPGAFLQFGVRGQHVPGQHIAVQERPAFRFAEIACHDEIPITDEVLFREIEAQCIPQFERRDRLGIGQLHRLQMVDQGPPMAGAQIVAEPKHGHGQQGQAQFLDEAGSGHGGQGVGTEGRTRTGKGLLPVDFESTAFTNFATSAW